MEEAARSRDGNAGGDGLGEPETVGLVISRTEAVGRAMSVGAEVVAEADRQGTEFPSSLLGLRALADRVAGRCGQRVEAYDDDRQPLEGPIYLAPSEADAIRLITSYDGGRWLVCELDRNGRVRADADSADPAVATAVALPTPDPFEQEAAHSEDQETRELAAARLHWRIAAILFFGGGFGAIPSDALHSPEQPATIYLLPLLAIVSGLVCWGALDEAERPLAAPGRGRGDARDRGHRRPRGPRLCDLLHLRRDLRGLRLPQPPGDRPPRRLRLARRAGPDRL